MSRSFAAITYALKQVKKTWKSWEISRLFELKEPDSNDLGVNETCYNSDVIVSEEEWLKDEDRISRLDIPSSQPCFLHACHNLISSPVFLKLNLPLYILYKTWKFDLRRSILVKLGRDQYCQIGFYYLQLSLNIRKSEKSEVRRYNPNLVNLKFWF